VRSAPAFEAGTLKPELCNAKIEELQGRLRQIEGERARLEGRIANLEIASLDLEQLQELLGRFEDVLAAGTSAQKKHLLHQLVKEVRIHSRDAAEAWYRVPTSTPAVRRLGHMAPQIGRCTNRVSLWEHAVAVRVVVRMPCEEAFGSPSGLVLAAARRARPRANVGGLERGWAPPPDLGPPGRTPQAPDTPKLGPTSEPSFFIKR